MEKISNFYPDEQHLQCIIRENTFGQRLLVPRIHLFGIQGRGEYDKKKEGLIRKALKDSGIAFLIKKPILVCALPGRQNTLLAIVDGHHRSRYSGIYGIELLPSIIVSPSELTDILRQSGRNTNIDNVINNIEYGVFETLHEFSTWISDAQQPKIIPGITSIDQLRERFTNF